jgi:glyoxylase-like metal-dependent hydrolase (beta-lactamase superfamily II)
MEAIIQITEHIHALMVPFKMPISPEKVIDRDVYSYIVFGDKITLIDNGVTGAETIIFDDRLLTNDEIVNLDEKIRCKVMHTPGHSRGSITLIFENE